MEENQNIANAMLLKEAFTAFYEAKTVEEALKVLEEWTEQCEESALKPFKLLGI